MVNYDHFDNMKPKDLSASRNRNIPEELKQTFSYIGPNVSVSRLHGLHARRLGVNCFPALSSDWNFAYVASGLFRTRKLAGYSLSAKLSVRDELELLELGWRSAILRACVQEKIVNYENSDSYLGFFVQVKDSFRQLGIAENLLKKMKESGLRKGAKRLFIPLQLPSIYDRENLFKPIEEFGFKVRDDGEYADHWLRLHTRMGARIIGIYKDSHQYVYTDDEIECLKSMDRTAIEIVADDKIVIELKKDNFIGLEKCQKTNFYINTVPCVWVVHELD